MSRWLHNGKRYNDSLAKEAPTTNATRQQMSGDATVAGLQEILFGGACSCLRLPSATQFRPTNCPIVAIKLAAVDMITMSLHRAYQFAGQNQST